MWRKKKEGWQKNGIVEKTLRSLHGHLRFPCQNLKRAGESCNFLDTQVDFQDKTYISSRLQEYALWLSLQNSYSKVEKLLNRQVHDKLISSVKIRSLVIEKARQISVNQVQEVDKINLKPCPKLAKTVNLYSKHKGEVLLFEDGILVKGQKYHRKSKNRPAPSKKGHKKRPATDIALCPNRDGTRSFVIGGIGEQSVSLPKVMKAHIVQQFEQYKRPLRLVCITDGASQIKTHYEQAFGVAPIRILDWYHLKKKVNELCIQICHSKTIRQEAVKTILAYLWKGKVQDALSYLKEKIQVRKQDKHTELINYLAKHKKAIIDYKRRKKLGKVIGSGCMESGVKQAVAVRQKSQGMSWMPNGSKALAILTVHQMNEEWDNLWAFNALTG